jgi:hypothetical protein
MWSFLYENFIVTASKDVMAAMNDSGPNRRCLL